MERSGRPHPPGAGLSRDGDEKFYVQDRMRQSGRTSGNGSPPAPTSTYAVTPPHGQDV